MTTTAARTEADRRSPARRTSGRTRRIDQDGYLATNPGRAA
jgi:hypothetical protein